MAAAANKQQLLDKTLAVLKKKYPAGPEAERRPVLEEVIYAIVREGIAAADADAAYARIKIAFFDWNEVRVSTVQEVVDVLGTIPDAGMRAVHMVEFLQEHFERTYSFELDDLEKKGVKQASKQLARYKDKGVNDYAVAWVTQRALGGHAIPLDEPTIRVLMRLHVIEGEIDDFEATRASIEHFIPKAKGYEFTEGIIPFAAEICTPDVPKCPICPLKSDCPTGLENAAKAKAKPKGK